MLNSMNSAGGLSYNEFVDQIKLGNVEEVEISDVFIRGQFKQNSPPTNEQGRKFNLVKVEDENLVPLLAANKVKFKGVIENTWLKDILFAWVIPLGILFLLWSFVLKRFSPGSGIMGIGKSRAKLAAQKDIKVTFKDVAGIDEARGELEELVEFLKTPERFKRLGGKIPRGVLLVGAPGTGKTLLAKALAGEAGVPFYSISGSDFIEMFVGVGASRVRDLFASAKKSAPCIVFIDEIDSIGRARSVGVAGTHEEREQTLNQLLAEMDGFEPNQGVIVVAATNRPEILDPALLRPGRFDRHISIAKPDIKGRHKILEVHTKAVSLDPDVNLEVVAQRTAGFVGADLANIVNEAALLAGRKGKLKVGMQEFEVAIDRVIAGLEMKSKVMTKKEKEITAYHESGHAIVAMNVKHADPVHKVSIIPRGIGALGFTLQLPTEDRNMMTLSELLDRLAVLLGGRIAEKIVFNEISTGAENDLKRATEIAKSMVKDYGMSERMGLVTYERDRRPMFLDPGMQLGSSKDYSEATAREIDLEIKSILDDTEKRVFELLKDKRDQLNALATRLLEKEVVEKDEITQLIYPPRDTIATL
ncbi:MAG: ATP-dependent zinc metalloprotease FtsH [Deltaproteobacteria bacterium]|nr:ATP-dependent zinc metalloprotease FtsH [Deltaproteobacteria bacterium]